MIVTVDANILFSALISANGRIARLLTDPSLSLRRVSCHYAVVELFKHQPKIVKYAKKPLEDVIDDLSMLIGNLKLYNESLIEPHHWQEAERLTTNIDHFDISYVALTLQTGGWLWTGDKKLTTHLQALGFNRVLNTEELYQMLNQPEKED
ncbi:PIN domain-containing protein [Larkinella sp. C7]|uniref:PIN domain-containing protein n=1 Tax=Larkinella sp. C7 TaxID=2576607 RepID=UPI0011110940|nr:PIN domain-containing protein [Larkinella sp. C7]